MIEPLRTYHGAPTSENDEILGHIQRVHTASEQRGTWVLDGGFDRRQLLVRMLKFQMAFLVRQRGDRHIRTADGQQTSVQQRAAHIYQHEFPERLPFHGWVHTERVFLWRATRFSKST